MRSGTIAALASLALAGCNCGDVPTLEGAPCDPGNVCPEGYLCEGGLCHSVGGTGGGSGGNGGGASNSGGGAAQGGGSAMGGGAANGGGTANLCQGVTCKAPSCKNGSTLTTEACSPQSGQCVEMNTACPNGCNNNMCTGDACAGMVCNMPPAAMCQSGSLVTFADMGTCANGQCKYMQTTMDCGGHGCANGACLTGPQTFTQILPRVRHAITAIDQAPGSMGANVVAVGPGGALSTWDGAAWTKQPSSGTTADFTSIWFPNSNLALITSTSGVAKWNNTQLSQVQSFPGVHNGATLVDVHGKSEGDYFVADDQATVYHFTTMTGWGTTTQATVTSYAMKGIYVDESGHISVYGSCGGNQCIVDSVTGISYGVHTNDTGTFSALGPSLDAATASGTYLWAGGDNESVTRFNSGAIASTFFDTMHVPSLSSDGTLIGITGGGFGTTSRFVWALSEPGTSYGSLYLITGSASAPTVTALANTFYGIERLAKNDAAGIVFVDSHSNGTGGSTIIRRSSSVDEALDLGAETWAGVVPAGSSGGYVISTIYGDIAVDTGGPTYLLLRTTANITANAVAAGANVALFVGENNDTSSALVQRVKLAQGAAHEDLVVPDSPTALYGICRTSDTEWYVVGDFGSVYKYDGNTLTEMTNPATDALKSVDCGGAGIAVTCGDNGTVMTLSGSTWTTVTGGPQGNLSSCRYVGNAVYVAGDGVFAKYAGGQWTTLPAQQSLTALVAVSANEIYAASGMQVMRFNGTGWQMAATSPQTLNGGGLVGNHVMFAGNAGVVLEGQ